MAMSNADAFNQAVADVSRLSTTPSNEDALRLYGLRKVATGESLDASPKPDIFDLKGRALRSAWQNVVDEDLSADEAKESYVSLVEELKEKLGFGPAS
jgi:diazepam-binding inhibitor (GABA receptor modulating acyl-CoA-binding protein)